MTADGVVRGWCSWLGFSKVEPYIHVTDTPRGKSTIPVLLIPDDGTKVVVGREEVRRLVALADRAFSDPMPDAPTIDGVACHPGHRRRSTVNKHAMGTLVAMALLAAPEESPPDTRRHGPPRIRSGKRIARTGTREKARRARQTESGVLRSTPGGESHEQG